MSGIIAKDESSAGSRIVRVLAVNSTTGVPADPGSLSAGDLKISKAGGAEANAAGTWTHLGGGTAIYQATAGEVDTAGLLVVRVAKSGFAGSGDALVTSGLRADVRQVNGGATDGYNATLKLKALDISNNAGNAITAVTTASGSYHGIYANGSGSGAGIKALGGAGTADVPQTAGPGIDGQGGYSWTGGSDPIDGQEYGGPGIRGSGKFAPGITAKSYGYAGLSCFSDGANGVGASFLGYGAGQAITVTAGATADSLVKLFIPLNANAHGIIVGAGSNGECISFAGGAKAIDSNGLPSSLGTVTMDVAGNLSGTTGDRAYLFRGTTAAVAGAETGFVRGDFGVAPGSSMAGQLFCVPAFGIFALIKTHNATETTFESYIVNPGGGDLPDGLDFTILPATAVLAAITHAGATIPTVSTVSGNVGGRVNLADNVVARGTSATVTGEETAWRRIKFGTAYGQSMQGHLLNLPGSGGYSYQIRSHVAGQQTAELAIANAGGEDVAAGTAYSIVAGASPAYTPADTSGTTTLLSRLTSTRAGYLDNLVNVGASGVVITPLSTTVSAGEVTESDLTAYQYSGFSFTFTINDSNGNPVNLTGKTIKCVFYTLTPAPTFAFQLATGGSGITIGGPNSNQVTITSSDTNTQTARTLRYVLRNTTDDSIIGAGSLDVKKTVDAQ